MSLPNLILGGAPKCGTSSVYRWLVSQRGVRGAPTKETFYLLDVGHPLGERRPRFHRDGIEGYARLFPDEAGAPFRLDATTHYLYQDTAVRVLASLATRPRVAFLLREPAMRAFSSFRFSQETLGVVDPAMDFAAFVDCCRGRPERLRDHVRTEASCYVLGRDLAYGRYADYLLRYADALGRERVHIALTEALLESPRAVLTELAAFYGLDPLPLSFELTHENETHAVRHPKLRAAADAARRFVDDRPRLERFARRAYWNVQQRGPARPMTSRDRATVEHLRAEYAEANARLAHAFGISLGAFDAPLPNPGR